MGPGLKKSRPTTIHIDTAVTRPASEPLTSTPVVVASPSTRASGTGGTPLTDASDLSTSVSVPVKQRVRGPTRGKRVRRLIAEHNGERIPVYVTQEMRAFCGVNANKIASEIGAQIRWICAPNQEIFYSSWKKTDSVLKDAVIQAVRDKFIITENEDEYTELVEEILHEKANILYKDWKWRMGRHYETTKKDGKDPYQHFFEGTSVDGWKYMIDHVFNDPKREHRKEAGRKNRDQVPYGHTTGSRSFPAAMTISADRQKENKGVKLLDFCDLYEASHLLKETGEWINPVCKEKHERMVAMRDEAALSGTSLSTKELSRGSLGEAKTKNYIRGLGNGPKPSTWFSKSKSPLARQDQLQKLQHELDLMREEREEDKRRWEEEKKHREEEDRRHAEERSVLLKELAEFRSFMMSQKQNSGQGS